MLSALALSFGTAAGICVGLLFVVAAVAKLRHRAELPAVIANYRLLPRAAVVPAAALLPWAELGVGLLLLLGGKVGAIAAWPAAALLLIFAVAMHVNLRRGRSHIDCGCGISAVRQPLRRALVWRNVALAAALVPLALTPSTLESAAWAGAVAAGVGFFVLILFLDALLALPSIQKVGA